VERRFPKSALHQLHFGFIKQGQTDFPDKDFQHKTNFSKQNFGSAFLFYLDFLVATICTEQLYGESGQHQIQNRTTDFEL